MLRLDDRTGKDIWAALVDAQSGLSWGDIRNRYRDIDAQVLSIQEQIYGEPSDDGNLVDVIARILQNTSSQNVLTHSTLEKLRKAILLPQERRKLEEALNSKRLGCANCGHEFHEQEVLTQHLSHEGRSFYCTNCVKPTMVRCQESGCDHLVDLPAKVALAMNKPRQCVAHAGGEMVTQAPIDGLETASQGPAVSMGTYGDIARSTTAAWASMLRSPRTLGEIIPTQDNGPFIRAASTPTGRVPSQWQEPSNPFDDNAPLVWNEPMTAAPPEHPFADASREVEAARQEARRQDYRAYITRISGGRTRSNDPR